MRHTVPGIDSLMTLIDAVSGRPEFGQMCLLVNERSSFIGLERPGKGSARQSSGACFHCYLQKIFF